MFVSYFLLNKVVIFHFNLIQFQPLVEENIHKIETILKSLQYEI
jgi:hypothetical protein